MVKEEEKHRLLALENEIETHAAAGSQQGFMLRSDDLAGGQTYPDIKNLVAHVLRNVHSARISRGLQYDLR
jgi:hypothetical protein